MKDFSVSITIFESSSFSLSITFSEYGKNDKFFVENALNEENLQNFVRAPCNKSLVYIGSDCEFCYNRFESAPAAHKDHEHPHVKSQENRPFVTSRNACVTQYVKSSYDSALVYNQELAYVIKRAELISSKLISIAIVPGAKRGLQSNWFSSPFHVM